MVNCLKENISAKQSGTRRSRPWISFGSTLRTAVKIRTSWKTELAYYLKALLGHSACKTSEIYTHVSNKALGKIRSPLDDLDL